MSQRHDFLIQHRDRRDKIFPLRDESLLTEGLQRVRRDASTSLRAAWPYRNTDLRAYVVVLANVLTLRDVARLSNTA